MDDLVERAKAGDQDAYTALYDQNKARIRNLAARFSPHDGEDLAQECFIQAFRKLHLFRGNSKFSTWLYRVALNCCLMHLRGSRRRGEDCTILAGDSLFAVDDERSTGCQRREGLADSSEQERLPERKLLTHAISNLPAGFRKIFIMHEVLGYEHREIAQMMGCSIGNSKSQNHKAKLRLQKLIRP